MEQPIYFLQFSCELLLHILGMNYSVLSWSSLIWYLMCFCKEMNAVQDYKAFFNVLFVLFFLLVVDGWGIPLWDIWKQVCWFTIDLFYMIEKIYLCLHKDTEFLLPGEMETSRFPSLRKYISSRNCRYEHKTCLD